MLKSEQIVTLKINAKCADLCDYRVIDADGIEVVAKPYENPLRPGSDYINLQIDVATGKIIGWDADLVRQNILEQINDE